MKLSWLIPEHTKSVEFYAIKADFSHYTKGWRVVRQDMRNKLDSCGWCHEPFKDGDAIALGFRNGARNMVLCQRCAVDAARKGG